MLYSVGFHPLSLTRGPGRQRGRVFLFTMSVKQSMRVVVFVDGFNLYHAINDLSKPTGQKHYLKWLNLRALSQALIHPKDDTLVQVLYFSALATWLDDHTRERHRRYIKALESTHVVPIMGTFKKKPRVCRKCQHEWYSHEEKESDVNLAIHLVKLAYQDAFDKAIIFSADTDLAPAISMVREIFPQKIIFVAMPKHRAGCSAALKQAAHSVIKIQAHHFEKNLFGKVVWSKDKEGIHRLEKYDV